MLHPDELIQHVCELAQVDLVTTNSSFPSRTPQLEKLLRREYLLGPKFHNRSEMPNVCGRRNRADTVEKPWISLEDHRTISCV